MASLYKFNKFNTSAKMMLYYTVIFACFTSQFLSVNALRCHQCNSHEDEDCYELRLNTPNAPTDTQYLKECDGEHKSDAFCRKTVLKVEATGEFRIIRSCGWIKDKADVGNSSCFTADNEGYKQMICACSDTDGCNGVMGLSISKWNVIAAGAISGLVSFVLSRN